MSDINPYIAPTDMDKQGANPGAAEPKKPYLHVIDIRNIVHFPRLNSQSGAYEGNIILKPGTYPIRLYQTPDKQNIGFETSGDADAMGIANKIEGSYPGYNREFAALIHNLLGQGLVVIRELITGEHQLIGSDAIPVYMGSNYTSDATSNTVTCSFGSTMNTNVPVYYYDGEIPTATQVAVDAAATTIDASAGRFFRMQNASGDTAVTIASITGGQDGDVISLIGSFGDKPANVKATDDILLCKGAQWNAVEGSVLSLRAMEVAAGALVWIEIDRK